MNEILFLFSITSVLEDSLINDERNEPIPSRLQFATLAQNKELDVLELGWLRKTGIPPAALQAKKSMIKSIEISSQNPTIRLAVYSRDLI